MLISAMPPKSADAGTMMMLRDKEGQEHGSAAAGVHQLLAMGSSMMS